MALSSHLRRRLPVLLLAVCIALMPVAVAVVSASENLLSTLFRPHTAIMLFIEPQSGQIIDANEAAARFYGYPIEQLTRMKIQDFNLLSAEEVAAERAHAAAEQRNYFVFPHRLADGSIRTVEVYSSPIRLNDGRTVLHSIIHDITGKTVVEGDLRDYQARLEQLVAQRSAELDASHHHHQRLLWVLLTIQGLVILLLGINIRRRYLAERALREEQAQLVESRALYESLVDSLPLNIYRVDGDGHITFANRALLEELGTHLEALRGKSAFELFPQETAATFRAEELRVMAERAPLHTIEQNRFLHGGELRSVELIKTPIFGPSGQVEGVQAIFWDITDRLQADQQLRTLNRDFLTFLENTTDFLYFKDADGRYRFCSQPLAIITGHRSWREMVGKHDSEVFPPEMARIYAKEEEPVYSEALPLLNKVTPYYNADGVLGWVSTNKWPVLDEGSRRVSGLLGISRDITELTRAQEQLQANEEMLRTLIDAMPDIVCFKDGDGRWLLANHFDLHLFQLDGVDYVGKTDAELAIYSDFYREALSTCQVTDERAWRAATASRQDEEIPRPDGSQLVFDVIKIPTFHADGQRKGLVVVGRDITERKQFEQQLAYLAHYDPLTRLPNRTLLADRLHVSAAQAQRSGRLLAVCYLDLDGFKPINDTHGHQIGDQLLVEVAERLRLAIRAGDTVARLGGDEFVLLLTDLINVEESRAVLRRITAVIAEPFALESIKLTLSASIGATLYPLDNSDADTLLRHADQAMYSAKEGGRHRIEFFDPDRDLQLRARREAQQRISSGLRQGEFSLHYQPKVEMPTGRVFGAEALIRWQHPERGLLPPGEFLPLLTDSPVALELDLWVLAQALRQTGSWHRQGLPLAVSVNISAHALQMTELPRHLEGLLANYPHLPRDALELEILESTALEDIERVSRVIQECSRLGVSFALDDFGTGYSSLTYLRHLPAGTLKIDQSFVRDMLEDPGDRAIVEGVIGLSNAFRRRVIAEGVESEQHGTLLMQLGCQLAQGYGIAKPMPAEELMGWAARYQPPPQWLTPPPE